MTNQDLQAGSYLVKDYREIILSQDVLEKVTSDLKLDLSPKALASKVKVTVPVDTVSFLFQLMIESLRKLVVLLTH